MGPKSVVESTVWLRFESWLGPPAREVVCAALLAAGLDGRRCQPDEAPYGAILFGAPVPGLEGLLRQLSRAGTQPVVAIAASQRLLDGDLTWRLLAAGAADVLAWDTAGQPARQVAARFKRWRDVDSAMEQSEIRGTLVGESPGWRSLLREIVEAAMFTQAPVLITGESGTGKELVARMIHRLDPRRSQGECVVLDCTTVVPTLSGSEFFGHEKGAFTGAVSARDGAFAMADQGTLFLDEISELPLPLQAELLRVIQEGMYKRVGSNTWRRTDFRLVAATNRDLLQEQTAGRFRHDLYYRLAGWAFHLPSLAERRADIPLLAQHFLHQALPRQPDATFHPAVSELLRQRAYPGNIRDLRQLIARIAARHTGSGPITVGDVPPEDRPAPPAGDWSIETPPASEAGDLETAVRRALSHGLTLREIMQQAGDMAVSVAFADAYGNLQQAARRLGVTDRALQLRRASGRVPLPDRHPDAVA